MKKLELKFGRVKEMLTKDQMKMISGGFNCTFSGGTNPWGTLGCDTSTGITSCGCQDLFDQLCESSNSCDNIDCGCQ